MTQIFIRTHAPGMAKIFILTQASGLTSVNVAAGDDAAEHGPGPGGGNK